MNKSETLKFDLIGKEFETAKSGKCFIIDYKRCNDVTVMFYEPMYVVKCEMGNLRKGNVNNPLYPNVFGVGCVGVGKYGNSHKRCDCGTIYCKDYFVKIIIRAFQLIKVLQYVKNG